MADTGLATVDAVATDRDQNHPERDHTAGPAAPAPVQRPPSRLVTTRSVDQSPTDTPGSPAASTVGPRRLLSSVSRHRSPTPVVPTRVADISDPMTGSGGSRGRPAPSERRQFRSDRVFATVDAVSSAQKRSTPITTAHTDHHHSLSISSQPSSERQGAGGRVPTASLRSRSRRVWTPLSSSTLRTTVTHDAAEEPTATDRASRSTLLSGSPPDSRTPRREQQSQQPHRMQPSVRLRFTDRPNPEPPSRWRRPRPGPSDLASERRPNRGSSSSTGTPVPSTPEAGTREAGSTTAARQPSTALDSLFKRVTRRRDTAQRPVLRRGASPGPHARHAGVSRRRAHRVHREPRAPR
jgi:hypothetical protein